MDIGIIADTHNEVARTRFAVDVLKREGAELLVHCGDLAIPEIVAECAALPFYFVFGNHDSDTVPYLRAAAEEHGATGLEWGDEFSAAGKRIAVVHGHLTSDLRPLLNSSPDYLLSGHSHFAEDWYECETHRINPGALFRADDFSVAMLNVQSDVLRYIPIPE